MGRRSSSARALVPALVIAVVLGYLPAPVFADEAPRTFTEGLKSNPWATLKTLNPTTDSPGSCAPPGPGSSFSSAGFNATPAVVTETIGLSAHANKTVKIRFYFDTGDRLYNEFEGWYVDEIKITDAPPDVTPTVLLENAGVTEGWTTAGSHGTTPGWHLTDRRSPGSFTGMAWWYGSESTGTFEGTPDPTPSNGCNDVANFGELVSPAVTLGSNSTLTFKTLWQIEGVDPNAFDLMRVQIEEVTSADLALTKADSPDPVSLGASLTYSLHVTNSGPSAATTVSVVDTLPSAVTFVSVTPAACVYNGGSHQVSCSFSSLAAGAAVDVIISVSAPATVPSTLTNTATASSSTSDPNPDNNTALQVTAVQGITGLAECRYVNPTSDVTLPNASVKLFSGSVEVASTTAASNGMWAVSGLQQVSTTYTVLYEGSVGPRLHVCGTAVTVDGFGNGTAARPTPVQNERGNTSWPTATLLTGTDDTDRLYTSATERWYVFAVPFNSEVSVRLAGPTNYGLALFRDLGKISEQLKGAADGKAATASSNGTAAAPLGATPLGATPLGATPLGATPLGATPLGATPLGATPLGATPLGATPLGATPLGATPLGATPLGATPLGATPLGATLYVTAQAIGLLGFQSEPSSPKILVRNSYGLAEYFYARIYPVNGVVNPAASFTFTLDVGATDCAAPPSSVGSLTWPTSPGTPSTRPRTVILTNTARLRKENGLPLTSSEALAHLAQLSSVSARPESAPGVVVDLAGSSGPGYVASPPPNVYFVDGLDSLYSYWDGEADCAPAANPVAARIRDVIIFLRGLSGPELENVALIGSHHVIPHLLIPDHVELMNEVNFETGAIDPSKTRAQVTGGYIPTDDYYGSFHPVLRFDHELHVPEIGVGRLVETLEDVQRYLNVYLGAPSVVTVPAGSPGLVTGYDFLSDLAADIQTQLTGTLAAPGLAVDASLVDPPTTWTANQLREKLGLAIPGSTTPPPASPTSYRYINLNAHFSPWELLAADNQTTMNSLEIANLPASDTRFNGTLVLSIGCHSGFGLVKPDLIGGIQDIDYVQGFLRAGATLAAPTTYGYGDTDFVRYTEELLSNITKELRYDDIVSIGRAHFLAKQVYISRLATLTGADEKALAALTLYGLPMQIYDFPAGIDATRPGAGAQVTPGAADTQGLSTADLVPSFNLIQRTKTLTIVNPGPTDPATVDAHYWANQVTLGSSSVDEVTVIPFRPVLPRVVRNIASTTGALPRGVAFLYEDHTDHAGLRPLVAVPATEIAGLHPAIDAPHFWPQPQHAVNELLIQPAVGLGLDLLSQALVFSPAQFRSVGTTGTGTHRVATNDSMGFRVYYLSSTDAALFLAAPPSIVNVSTSLSPTAGKLRVAITVAGPAEVDFKDVLVTFTAEPSTPTPNGLEGHWNSCSAVTGELFKSPGTAAIACTPLTAVTETGSQAVERTYTVDIDTQAADPSLMRFWVQAIGGSGAWAAENNGGAYFRLAPPEDATLADPKTETALSLTTVPNPTAAFGSAVQATAVLSAGGTPLPSNPEIVFTFGNVISRVQATPVAGTEAATATATFVVDVDPRTATYPLTAAFAETPTHLGMFVSKNFTVTPGQAAFTQLRNVHNPVATHVARLVSGGVNLNEQVVFVDVPATATTPARTFTRLTDGYGRLSLDPVADQLPTGISVTLRYLGTRRYLAAADVTVFVVRQIAFSSTRDGNAEIYLLSANPGAVTRLTNHPAADITPAWSPNGTKVAFSSNRDGGDDGENFDIYVLDLETGDITRLTTHKAVDTAPAWSPDGTQIAFSTNRDKNFEIYVMNANGTGATNLTNHRATDTAPAWSPDGAQIAFSTNRDRNFEIYVMNANGTVPTRLTTNSAVDTTPTWSPDGAQIAFSTNRDKNFEIYVMNANGTVPTRLTNNPAVDSSPSWSQEGSQIAFSTNRNGVLNYEIYVMDADGGNPTNLTGHPAIDATPAW